MSSNERVKLSRSQKILLSKLLVAFGWVDDELHAKELKLVQELLKDEMQITHHEHLEVRLYSEFPLSNAEVKHLIHCFRLEYKDPKLIEYANEWIMKLIKADGVVRDSEMQLYQHLEQELTKPPITEFFSSAFQPGKTRSPFARQVALGRDRHLDDYLNNPVFFRVYRYLISNELRISISKQDLRMFCLIATLISYVYNLVERLKDTNLLSICNQYSTWAKLDKGLAENIVYVALHLEKDLYAPEYHCRRLLKYLDLSGREELVKILFEMVMHNTNSPRIKQVVEDISTRLNVGKEKVYE